MNKSLIPRGVAIVAVLAVTTPARAHHGGGAFDQAEMFALSGTVTEMRFANPHVLVFFDVTSDAATETWSGWLAAPRTLVRAGWTRRTLEPGDQITVEGHTRKGGTHMLRIRRLVDPDGRDLPLSER